MSKRTGSLIGFLFGVLLTIGACGIGVDGELTWGNFWSKGIIWITSGVLGALFAILGNMLGKEDK